MAGGPLLSSNFFSGAGGAVNDIFGAIGSFQSAGAYNKAAAYAEQNANITRQSTAVKQLQTQRQIFQTIGGQKADVAGAGLAASGSALDILKSSMAQGALTKQLVTNQGMIDANSYEAQATAYKSQASSAKSAGIGSLVGGALSIASIFLSDERLKQDLTLIGVGDDGISEYAFRFIGQPEVWTGVLAQDVLNHRPEAVSMDRGTGYLCVDYAMIGRTMQRYEEAA